MKTKRLFGVLLALCLVFSLLPFGSLAAGFVDVVPDAYYAYPVTWAVKHTPQITDGVDDTHFAPNATCTRDQVVTFLWRAMGEPAVSAKNPFKDIAEKDYFYKAVLWAVEKGITDGTSDTTFSPKNACTRGQVVTFLWRALNKLEPQSKTSPFVDVKNLKDYFYTPVLWAVEWGVTDGTDDTHFSPAKTCTRGQIVTFLYRALSQRVSLISKQTTVNPDGSQSGYIFTYDDHGNNTLVTSLDGSKWEKHTFDANGNMIKRVDSLGNEDEYKYDDNGNVIIDDGEDVDVETDALGRVVKETHHYKDTDGNYDVVTVFKYDGDSDRLLEVLDGDGHRIAVFTYDDQGRRVKSEYYDEDGASPAYKSITEYDKSGNIIHVRDEFNDDPPFWNDVRMEYDKDGLLVKETMTSSAGDKDVTTYVYTFDSEGFIIKDVATTTMSFGKAVTTTEYTLFEIAKLSRFGGYPIFPDHF